MDRVNGSDLWVLVHPDRNHAGVPVMAMEHIRLPDVPGKFSRSTSKKGEAPIFIFSAINPFRVKDGMTNQINSEPIGGMTGLKDRKIGAHGLASPDRFRGDLQSRPELAVSRHDQANVVPQSLQGRGKGSHHIAHPTDFHHGGAFGGGKEHAHGRSNL